MRGRKPKLLKLDPSEQPVVAIPQCPAHLKGEAKREWGRITALLRDAARVTELDLAALAIYCQAWARHVEAEKQIAKTGGDVVPAPSGYLMQNPWLTVSNAAVKQMQHTLAELGIPWHTRGGRKKGEGAQPKSGSADNWEGLIANGA